MEQGTGKASWLNQVIRVMLRFDWALSERDSAVAVSTMEPTDTRTVMPSLTILVDVSVYAKGEGSRPYINFGS